MIVGLELSTGAWWDHQSVYNYFPFSWIYHQTSSILRDGVPRPLFLEHLAVDCPIFVQIEYGHSNSVMMIAVSCPGIVISQPFSILALTLFPTSSTVFPEYKPFFFFSCVDIFKCLFIVRALVHWNVYHGEYMEVRGQPGVVGSLLTIWVLGSSGLAEIAFSHSPAVYFKTCRHTNHLGPTNVSSERDCQELSKYLLCLPLWLHGTKMITTLQVGAYGFCHSGCPALCDS